MNDDVEFVAKTPDNRIFEVVSEPTLGDCLLSLDGLILHCRYINLIDYTVQADFQARLHNHQLAIIRCHGNTPPIDSIIHFWESSLQMIESEIPGIEVLHKHDMSQAFPDKIGEACDKKA